MKMLPVLAVLLFVVFVIIMAKYLLMRRASAMRALALRWGFHYSSGDSQVLTSPEESNSLLPDWFDISLYPASDIRTVSNVVEGERNGIKVLIFDSVVGRPKGAYCSFIATQTPENLFGVTNPGEKIIQASKCTMLYRFRFIQVPGTLSIRSIEDRLKNLAA
jgi:hypothetical protein